MGFPEYRPRRMRANEVARGLIRETRLTAEDFIYPFFVCPGEGVRKEIPSMPGVYRLSIDQVPDEMEQLLSLGITKVMPFGIPKAKDEVGSGAYAEDGIVQQAVRAVHAAVPDMYVICDVCLCEYTSHGHCGVLDEDGTVKNDETLELLAKVAVSQARAGANMVAPSDMMDGRVGAIRAALDAAGFADVPILAYSVKYASGYYGPFRDAAASAPAFGDRRGYQMDPSNVAEALREAKLDIEEGADLLMVKPALAYLDVLRAVHDEFGYPTVAYNVSGEYAMVKAAAANGWIDERRVVLETLLAMKRAGACAILTYHAKDAAAWLVEKE